MPVTIGPYKTTVNFNAAKLNLREKVVPEKAQQVDNQLHSPGRRVVGEQALQKSLQFLSKLFDEKNVQVTNNFDVSSGSEIRITDGDSGKTIVELPPHAVVEMANRAKERQTGWLIDILA